MVGPIERPPEAKHPAAQVPGGYTVRVAAKWLDTVGPPICPADGASMIDARSSGEDMRVERQEDVGALLVPLLPAVR
jgi:hypothetical protein